MGVDVQPQRVTDILQCLAHRNPTDGLVLGPIAMDLEQPDITGMGLLAPVDDLQRDLIEANGFRLAGLAFDQLQ